MTRDQAQAELEGVMDGLRNERPDFNTGWSVNAVPLREQLVGDVRLALLVLFGAVAAVLLIACGNIGSLMLTRASGRRRELAIRSAIGAGTGRLLTQLVCESLMLSAAGGVLGVLLASWILSGLSSWLDDARSAAALGQVSVDPSVLVFAGAITVLTTMVCGLAPAIGATGGSLVTALRDGAPSVSGGARGRLIRQGFVMAEIALALTVLCGAGLLGRSLMRVARRRPGIHRGLGAVDARHAAAADLSRFERPAHVSHARHRRPARAAGARVGRRHVVPAARGSSVRRRRSGGRTSRSRRRTIGRWWMRGR